MFLLFQLLLEKMKIKQYVNILKEVGATTYLSGVGAMAGMAAVPCGRARRWAIIAAAVRAAACQRTAAAQCGLAAWPRQQQRE